MDDQGTSSGLHDFDFLFGKWSVSHRKLRTRNVGSDDWGTFTGEAETRGLLGGLGNIEENIMPGTGYSGIALRTFDVEGKFWSIYWVSGRDGVLQPPVRGSFSGSEGLFEGEDMDGDRPIRARFLWRKNAGAPRWEQSFSTDGGATWETNWIMDFTRLSD